MATWTLVVLPRLLELRCCLPDHFELLLDQLVHECRVRAGDESVSTHDQVHPQPHPHAVGLGKGMDPRRMGSLDSRCMSNACVASALREDVRDRVRKLLRGSRDGVRQVRKGGRAADAGAGCIAGTARVCGLAMPAFDWLEARLSTPAWPKNRLVEALEQGAVLQLGVEAVQDDVLEGGAIGPA